VIEFSFNIFAVEVDVVDEDGPTGWA
jgi:hypothetical protein